MEIHPADQPIDTGSLHMEPDIFHSSIGYLQETIETDAVETVHAIHGFMRDATTLTAGTTVDNRKGLWAMFVKDADPDDIPYYGGAMRYAKRYAEMEKNTGDRDE